MDKVHRITYLYRDAGNYKFWGSFCVSGNLMLADLRPYLFDEEFFVPERIGLPSLVPSKKNNDDHLLHEFDGIEEIQPMRCLLTANELMKRVHAANTAGWL